MRSGCSAAPLLFLRRITIGKQEKAVLQQEGRMNLQHLKYIVEIAECGSITKAARKLFVSQPYLSKVVADFESRRNKQIFLRSNTGLQLTPYGNKVYVLALSIIHQMELLDHLEKDDWEEQKETRLSFSVANLILKENLLTDYFSISSAAGQEVDFRETTVEGCVENVQKETSEFAILVLDDYQKSLLMNVSGRNGLEYLELDEGYLYYHLHRDHPLAGEEKISIDSLVQYPFVKLSTDRFASFSSGKYKEEYPRIHVHRTIVVNHYHSYLRTVKNNGAFIIGNKWQISELEKMGIKSIRFSSLKHKAHLAVLKKEVPPFSEEAGKFLQLFKESYGLNRA